METSSGDVGQILDAIEHSLVVLLWMAGVDCLWKRGWDFDQLQ